MVENFIEMVKIYSPSKEEREITNYLIDLFKGLGAELYLDEGYKKYGGEAPTILAKFTGTIEGTGITLSAHTDVIEPNKGVQPIVEGNKIKTDGTTTLGGDDKAGIASIVEIIRYIKENNSPHKDIYIVITPGEELGLVGAKHIDWKSVPEDMYPAKNMLVLDNGGKAGYIAYAAPAHYLFSVQLKGKKAHAGIEPEEGINAIQLASQFIDEISSGRVNESTTSNIYSIGSEYPTNVVPDYCEISGEARSLFEEEAEKLLKDYDKIAKEVAEVSGGGAQLDYTQNYPALKTTDDLKFAKEFAQVYEKIGIDSKLHKAGGGADANVFAGEGFNPIIIGVGMNNMHTVDEYIEISELYKTTAAVINYITEVL